MCLFCGGIVEGSACLLAIGVGRFINKKLKGSSVNKLKSEKQVKSSKIEKQKHPNNKKK